MRMSVKAASLTSGAIWGGALLAVGVINLVKPKYGQEFLKMIASVYPCTGTERNAQAVLTRTVFGIADGAIGGCMFALLYNQFAKSR
jgi:hypothetical protein